MPRRRASQSPSLNKSLSDETKFEIPEKRIKTSIDVRDRPSTSNLQGTDLGPEKRNLSLEALFQVTDNELQNISRVSPHDGTSGELHPTDISTVTVTSTEDSDEPESGNLMVIPVAEKGVEKYQLKSDSLEEQGLKLVYTKQNYAQFEPNPISYGTYKSRSFKTNQPPTEKVVQQTEPVPQPQQPHGKKRKDTSKNGRHVCSYCGRGCAKPSVLQKHIRAHTGERPYPCLPCGFSFKTKSNLYKHCKSRAHALKAGLTTKMESTKDENGEEQMSTSNAAAKSEENISDTELADSDPDASVSFAENVETSVIACAVNEDHAGTRNDGQQVNLFSVEQPYSFIDNIVLLRSNSDYTGNTQELVSQESQEPIPILLYHSNPNQREIQVNCPVNILTKEPNSNPLETNPIAIPVTSVSTPVYSTAITGDTSASQRTYLISLPKSATSVVPSIPESLYPHKHIELAHSLSTSSVNSEVLFLPHPNCEPQAATKALRDLEDISDKVTHAKNKGLVVPTVVDTMPDKSLCVSFQIPSTPISSQSPSMSLSKDIVEEPTEETCEESSKHCQRKLVQEEQTVVADQSSVLEISSSKGTKSLSNVMLQERIQQLISDNAAIVDTPMADPPRPKRLSRQNSDISLSSVAFSGGQSPKPSYTTPVDAIIVKDASSSDDKQAILNMRESEIAASNISIPTSDIPNNLKENKEIKIQIQLTKDQSQPRASNVTVVSPPMIGQPLVQFPETSKKSNSTLTMVNNSPKTSAVVPGGSAKVSRATSVIKDLLLKGVLKTSEPSSPYFTSHVSSVPLTNPKPDQENALSQHISTKEFGPFSCDKCGVSFRQEQTLVIHKLYYCVQNKKEILATTADSVGSSMKDDIAKYFSPKPIPQKGIPVSSEKKLPETHTILRQRLLSTLDIPSVQQAFPQSQHGSHDKHSPGVQPPVSQASNVMPRSVASLQSKTAQTDSRTVPLPSFPGDSSMIGQPRVSVDRSEQVKGHGLRLNTALAAASASNSPKLTPKGTPNTPQTPGTPSSSLLKLKLQGMLLMKRSMSVERMLSQERENDSPIKFPASVPFHSSSPTSMSGSQTPTPPKKRRLKDNSGLQSRKRPILRRTESAPCGPLDGSGDASNIHNGKVQKITDIPLNIEALKENTKDNPDEASMAGNKPSYTVPVVTAQSFTNPVYLCSLMLRPLSKPLICQSVLSSVTLEPYPGMSIVLPAIAGSSATDEPVLHLPIQASKVSTWASKNIPGTPVKIPVLKTPSTPKGSVANTFLGADSEHSETSPRTGVTGGESVTMDISTPVKAAEKAVTPLYLYGHSFPSLRGSCHTTYCCIQRLQPMYVRQGTNKKISMYSNWRVAPQNLNPYGLTAKMLLTLYISKYTTDPVYRNAISAETANGVLTHSSYWDYYSKKGRQNGETQQTITCYPSHIESHVACIEETITEVQDEASVKEEAVNLDHTGKSEMFQGGFKSNDDYTYVRGRGRGKFVCDACGIRCKKPSMLFKHIRTHTDLRPYSCKNCNFSFKTKGNLTKHMRSKAHMKKCVDLGVVPIPTTVDETQVDREALARQTSILRKVHIFRQNEGNVEFDEDDVNDDDYDEDDDGNVIDEMPTDGRSDSPPEIIILEEPGQIQEVTVSCKNSKNVTPSSVRKTDNNSLLSAVETKCLGTIYGFPSRTTEKTVSSVSSSSRDNGTNDTEIARSLLDLSNQASTSSTQESTDDMIGKGTTLDSLIKALITRTLTKPMPNNSAVNPLMKSTESIHGPGENLMKPSQKSLVQVITIDSDSEDRSNSSEVPTQNLKQKSKNVQRKKSSIPASRPSKLTLKTEERNVTEAINPKEENSIINSAVKNSKNVDKVSYVASVGPIIGQLIRQEPVQKDNPTGTDTDASVPGVIPPFHFTHPFTGCETPLDKANLTLPLLKLAQDGGRQSNKSMGLENQVLMISPAKTGQNVLHLAPSQSNADLNAQTPNQQTIGSLVGHIINVAGSSDDQGSPATQHILFQGMGHGQSILIPFPSSLSSTFPVITQTAATDASTGTHCIKQTAPVSIRVEQTTEDSKSAVRNPEGGCPLKRAEQIEPRSKDTLQYMVVGPYICNICKKSFQQQHQLTLHKNIHYFERPFRCETCSISFRTKGHLLKHYRSDTHLAKQNMNTHFGIPTTDNPRPFKCCDCKVAFRNHGHLAKHLRSKMHITMLEKVGKLPTGTYAQIEKGNLNEIDASNCERTLESLHLMIDVANEATLNQADVNSLRMNSDSSATTDGSMDYEVMDESEPEEDGGLMIVDNVEDASEPQKIKVTEAVRPLQDHFQIHNRSPYERYKEGSNEKVTVEIKHEHYEFSDIGPGKSTPSRYGTGSDLEKEREGDNSSRAVSPRLITPPNASFDSPHKCGICRSGFKTLDSLNSHLITHAELRPYVCEYCDAGFTNGQSLKTHLQTHKRERPYICGHCGETFAKSENLKIHLVNHNKRLNLSFLPENPETDIPEAKPLRLDKTAQKPTETEITKYDEQNVSPQQNVGQPIFPEGQSPVKEEVVVFNNMIIKPEDVSLENPQSDLKPSKESYTSKDEDS